MTEVIIRRTRMVTDVLQALRAHPTGIHGYGMTGFLCASSGTIYPILKRLEAAGWTTSWTEGPKMERGVVIQPRKYYILTNVGRAHLKEWEERTERELTRRMKFIAKNRR